MGGYTMGKLPQRKNTRLKNYDYSKPGYYFITICTKDRMGIFGDIVFEPAASNLSGKMDLSDIGCIICECWLEINELYENVTTDAFCIMPNHIHGIIVISETDSDSPPSLAKIIQGFKSVTSRICYKYNYKTIWQANYYEHIIRNQEEYEKICEYIQTNPLKWEEDMYYI